METFRVPAAASRPDWHCNAICPLTLVPVLDQFRCRPKCINAWRPNPAAQACGVNSKAFGFLLNGQVTHWQKAIASNYCRDVELRSGIIMILIFSLAGGLASCLTEPGQLHPRQKRPSSFQGQACHQKTNETPWLRAGFYSTFGIFAVFGGWIIRKLTWYTLVYPHSIT
jgi:hypothetical protein